MSSIRISDANRSFGDLKAVNDVWLEIRDGEFFTLLGPSGCGKTTLLRSIAGLENLDSGSIMLDDQPIDRIPVHRRPIGMVFQNLALFPHLTVRQNVAYGLRAKRVAKTKTADLVEDALALVALDGLGDRPIPALSGGQQQRVALARALVTEPRVLLLDEPLSALDLKLRKQMQVELKRLQHRVGTTFVFVTHDQEEAMAMSDRIAVLNRGQIEQVGSPDELYQRPASRFVADFVGESNLIDGEVAAAENGAALKTSVIDLPVGASELAKPGARLTVSIRPEMIRMDAAEPGDDCTLSGTVTAAVYRGSLVRHFVQTGKDSELIVDVPQARSAAAGTRVELTWRSSDCWAVRTDSHT